MSLIYVTGPTGAGKSTICSYLKETGHEAYDTDEYGLPPEAVIELANQAKHKTVFLCGVTENDIALAPYFDKIICLTIGLETAKRRILTRKTSDFGKEPSELADILEVHQLVLDKYAGIGAVMVDASQTIGKIVEEIREKAEK